MLPNWTGVIQYWPVAKYITCAVLHLRANIQEKKKKAVSTEQTFYESMMSFVNERFVNDYCLSLLSDITVE